jgi:hypothetical protein
MRMLGALLFVSPFLALLVALAVLSPSWRWVAGFVAAISGYLVMLWVRHWLATQSPSYEEGRFGVLFYAAVTQAWAIAVMIYIGGALWWRSRTSPICVLDKEPNLAPENGGDIWQI